MRTTNNKTARPLRAPWFRVIALALGLALYAQAHAQEAAQVEPAVLESVRLASGLTIRASVGTTISVLYADVLGPTNWQVLTNVVMTSGPYMVMDWEASPHQRYYRAAAMLEAPVLESVGLASALTIRGSVGTTNLILYAQAPGSHPWQALTNVVLTSSPYVFLDWVASPQQRSYQAPPVVPSDPNRWAWIPPGAFTMGSPASEQDRWGGEGPQTQVTITHGFWMGRYEVTQAEYPSVIGSNPSWFTGDPNRPVEAVSWYDATNYCAKLTEAERAGGRLPAGYVYRLPTEAEWEYACRAGTTTRFYYGDDPGYLQLGNYAWYGLNCDYTTHPVGEKLPNRWGLYDMSGNVLEWCLDWYGGYPGASVTDPTGPSSGSLRVIRGGSWSFVGRYCRSASRGTAPDGRYCDIGFRAVLAPGQP